MAAGSGGDFLFAFLQEPPFCFRETDGRVSGCDVELARIALATLSVGDFTPVETAFADLLPGLVERRWRMTTGLFVTEARLRLVKFSLPIWALHDGLLTRADSPLGIAGYRSIGSNGVTLLGVVEQQAQEITALRLGVPESRIRRFQSQDAAADAVARGQVHAYASVAMAHRGYLSQVADRGLMVVDAPFDEHPPAAGAFAFAAEDEKLRDAVNGFLSDFLGSRDHRALMRRHGFADAEIDRVAVTTRA